MPQLVAKHFEYRVCSDERIHPGHHLHKQDASCLTLPVELSSIREEAVMCCLFLRPQCLTPYLTQSGCLVNTRRVNRCGPSSCTVNSR